VARLLDSAGRSSLICALSASRGRDGERATDPLHRARINAKTLGDAAHTFTSALTLIQGRLDSFLKLGGYPRSAESFALVLGPPKMRRRRQALLKNRRKTEGAKLKRELRAVCTEQAKQKKLTRAARIKFMDECGGGDCPQCGGGTICQNRECFCECTGGTGISGKGGVCGRCAPVP
jgi:hypothetical protein